MYISVNVIVLGCIVIVVIIVVIIVIVAVIVIIIIVVVAVAFLTSLLSVAVLAFKVSLCMCRMVVACAEWCFIKVLREMPEQNEFDGVEGVVSDPEATIPKRHNGRARQRFKKKQRKLAAKQEPAFIHPYQVLIGSLRHTTTAEEICEYLSHIGGETTLP